MHPIGEIPMSLDQALKKLTTGIYIVTSKQGTEINGMVASWISQVSFFPPLIMVAIKQGRRSHLMIEKGKVFAVHILNNKQKEMVPLFKNKKFLTTLFETKKTGAPIIKDVLAFLDCKLISKVTPGDHTLFIGEVLEGGVIKEGTPLSSNDLENIYGGLDYN
jgi:flavin reductase (DIM6/NTAB) family NADH-FMN oxidoreductase RutF